MELVLSGRKDIVCAASGVRTRALLRRRESRNQRASQDALKAAAEHIRAETDVDVIPIAADITTEEGRELVLAACPAPDILVNNAGGPPPGDFRDVTREDWIRAVDANMLTPFLIRAVVDGMVARGFGRIINITTSGVKSPATYPQPGISIGVRSGLTGFIGVLSRQLARHNVTINGPLPGRFETDRLRENLEFAARAAGHGTEDEALRVRSLIPAVRFGTTEEFGAFTAFLWSTHAGYLTGQILSLMVGPTQG
jgi:3-oxoacyl-[acyl-carrier protein] reductase